MLIYHKENGVTSCTMVMLGAGSSSTSHGKHVWDKHKECVDMLEDDGDVFVTGGTYVGAIYEGKFENRENFKHYFKKGNINGKYM